jgi:hypothetical protein
MIIRPACEREYTSLPNAILNDRRLSADTRAMVAWILSKPKNWRVRPFPLAIALSREGSRALGRTRLKRMFKEAMGAGYMARSEKQTHQDDGDWGAYVYFVGMPDDVAAAVKKTGVAVLAQARNARTQNAHTCGTHTQNQHTNQKELSPVNTDSKNLSPNPSRTEPSETDEEADEEELTEFGLAARDQGLTFVFENSEPYRSWVRFRGADGIPVADVIIREGARRRGVWMPSLFPPARERNSGAAT